MFKALAVFLTLFGWSTPAVASAPNPWAVNDGIHWVQTVRWLDASKAKPSVRTRPAAASALVGGGDVIGAITAAFNAVGGSPAQAIKVAKCESGLNPLARNGSYRGLFQIGWPLHARLAASVGVDEVGLWTAVGNARVAAALWTSSGWAPWSCRP